MVGSIESPVTQITTDMLKGALRQAGVEVYRTKGSEVALAERVRMHLMDSGVTVRISDTLEVRFTVRSQRSDFPNHSVDALFQRTRELTLAKAAERGFAEEVAAQRDLHDPSEADRLLDVWYEVTYRCGFSNVDDAVSASQWALTVAKYLAP
jgi:hypothetical protein